MTTLDGRREVIMEDMHVSSYWHGTDDSLSADMVRCASRSLQYM